MTKRLGSRPPYFATSLFAASLAAMTWSTQANADGELHVMNSGGEFGDALETCINEPLLANEGIKVITESPGGFAKLQAQAKSGVITNTTTDGSTGDLYRMVAADLVEPIDWSKLDPEPMFEEARNEYGFGAQYYSTIMAWRADAKAPKNFAEFFDTEAFPGRRALPDYPEFVLAFAALGGGMTADEVAKGIDLDKAFDTLERVKGDTIWWQSGAQPAQLLKDNEAQYAIAWSGRVIDQEGVEHSFNDGMLDISWWVVAKGITDEERDMLYKWMAAQSNAEAQACLVKVIPYPGPSPDLAGLVSEDVARNFPTYPANKDVQWLINGQWWHDNAAEVERRWNDFKLNQ